MRIVVLWCIAACFICSCGPHVQQIGKNQWTITGNEKAVEKKGAELCKGGFAVLDAGTSTASAYQQHPLDPMWNSNPGANPNAKYLGEKKERYTKIECLASPGDDCRKALNCTRFGQCSPAPPSSGLVCKATSNEDCKASEDCKNYGRCVLHSLGFCDTPRP